MSTIAIDLSALPDGVECECQNCDWRGPVEAASDILNCTLAPGEEAPVGECPECGCLAFLADGLATMRAAIAATAPPAPADPYALIAELAAALEIIHTDDDGDGYCDASGVAVIESALAKAAAFAPPPADAEISRMLTLSTSHVSYETASALDEGPPAAGAHGYPKGGYGWFILSAPDDPNDELLAGLSDEDCPPPPDLAACIAYARALGCDWLCLDSDGPVMAELPTFEW